MSDAPKMDDSTNDLALKHQKFIQQLINPKKAHTHTHTSHPQQRLLDAFFKKSVDLLN